MTSISSPCPFDPRTQVVGLDRELNASLHPEQPDPPVPVDELIIGVAAMSENAPHGGEMHPDGDETLYLISGRVRVVFLDSPEPDVELGPGDGAVVPRGTWHRVDVLEPCQIVYATPGPNREYRPMPGTADD